MTNLWLDDNGIGPEGAAAVAAALAGGACPCPGLATLSLGDNGIGPEGAVAVAGALQGGVCAGLT
eukprot:SAG22_NODE_18088_length_293_cov_1.324742_1_plen_64_part_01